MLCRQAPFSSPARLIVVDQAHRVNERTVEALRDALDVIRRNACVVLLAETELGSKHPLMTLGKAAAVESFAERGVPPFKPFALIEAVGGRDPANALLIMHEQLASGKELLEVLGLLGWQLQRWMTVRRLLALGYDAERIAQVCELKPWQIAKLQTEVAGRPLASLTRLLERCWQVDVDLKTGRAAGAPAVEQLVVEMCGSA